jgi:hypothetical protein
MVLRLHELRDWFSELRIAPDARELNLENFQVNREKIARALQATAHCAPHDR